MSRVKSVLKPIAFLMIFFVLLSMIQRRFLPKWDYPTHYSRTGRAVVGAYREPRNSLDVLWLGSSHMQNAASPIMLYQQHDIRSYNLATTGQPLPASYYRLKSVLREQSPKVVFIDVGYGFSGSAYQKCEPAWRKIIDSTPYRYPQDKLEMTLEMVRLNDHRMDIDDVYSGVLPILRYHENYLLDETQYADNHKGQIYAIKGQACITKIAAVRRDVWADPIEEEPDPDRTEELRLNLENQRENLQRIVDLCRGNGCDLVFVKAPVCATRQSYSGYWNQEKHDLIQELADSMGVTFVDANYEDIGIDWKLDTCDNGKHLNLNGSIKFTDFMGKWLLEHYSFDQGDNPDLDMIWDAQADVFNQEKEWMDLQVDSNLTSYLNRLQNGNYTVFTAVCESVGAYWTKQDQTVLTSILGSERNLEKRYSTSQRNMAYVAVGSKGQSVGEAYSTKSSELEGQLEDGTSYRLTSKYSGSDSTVSIIIDGQELQTQGSGVCFVVYDNDMHCVVDTATFNTLSKSRQGKHDKSIIITEFREGVVDYEYDTLKGL